VTEDGETENTASLASSSAGRALPAEEDARDREEEEAANGDA
jgi:hypothetical protein